MWAELERGENVDAVGDANGKTLLQIATRHGHGAVVRLLLAAGAQLELRDKNGHTALHLAAYYQHLPIVRELLSHRANMDPVGLLGTPLTIAASNGHARIVHTLLAAQAKVYAPGMTPESGPLMKALEENKGETFHEYTRFFTHPRACRMQRGIHLWKYHNVLYLDPILSSLRSSASATDEFGGTRAREARQVRRQAASGTTSGIEHSASIEHFKKH